VSGAAQGAVDLIEALNVSPWVMLLAINVFLLPVGTVLDTASAILC
jgi:TRAP-type C4-dicarboxylate transport system permease large subunit